MFLLLFLGEVTMKNLVKVLFMMSVGALFFAACATDSGMQNKSDAAYKLSDEALLAEQTMLAINWMQQSGE